MNLIVAIKEKKFTVSDNFDIIYHIVPGYCNINK